MKNITEALEIIQRGYSRAMQDKQEAYICQLTNNDQGFNTWEIDAIKQKASELYFELPTHTSVLPIGKKPTSQKLFDGLIDIYCNDNDLQNMVDSMKTKVC